MPMMRSPSTAGSWTSMGCCLLAGDAPEYRADGHAEAGKIALAQNVAGHDFPCCENIPCRRAALHQDIRALVHLDAQIGERDTRAQRIAVIRRRVYRPGPVGLLRR